MWPSLFNLMILGAAVAASAQDGPNPTELYKQGRLAEARRAARASADSGEKALACRLALYANDLAEARTCLRRLAQGDPGNRTIAAQLAEAEYRSHNFMAAAAAFEAAGRAQHAERLRYFGPAGPYAQRLRRREEIGFLRVDPLPVVAARINGGPLLNFVIDTGAADTIIDPAVAKQAGARAFGEQAGLFAGGATATVVTAAVNRLDMGKLAITNVPVTILPTAAFSDAFGGLPIAGVIGTGLMSQFRTTIDYPRRRLVFEPRGSASAARDASLPMWLLGDHYILVEGSMNGGPELAFVDTGLAGLGCTVPQSTFDRIRPRTGQLQAGGAGGGGDVGKVLPFEADIALGSVMQRNVSCIFGPFPSQLETLGGTRIGMLVSHAFLMPYAVTFDFDRMKMVLAKPGR